MSGRKKETFREALERVMKPMPLPKPFSSGLDVVTSPAKPGDMFTTTARTVTLLDPSTWTTPAWAWMEYDTSISVPSPHEKPSHLGSPTVSSYPGTLGAPATLPSAEALAAQSERFTSSEVQQMLNGLSELFEEAALLLSILKTSMPESSPALASLRGLEQQLSSLQSTLPPPSESSETPE